MPLVQKYMGDETNLLQSCFGAWIIHVWRLYVTFGGIVGRILIQNEQQEEVDTFPYRGLISRTIG